VQVAAVDGTFCCEARYIANRDNPALGNNDVTLARAIVIDDSCTFENCVSSILHHIAGC
jgi:hypothetical protein